MYSFTKPFKCFVAQALQASLARSFLMLYATLTKSLDTSLLQVSSLQNREKNPYLLLVKENCKSHVNASRYRCPPQPLFWSNALCHLLLVVGLVDMQLIFFSAAHTMLCFRSVNKMVPITDQCFSHCWTVPAQHQGPLCSSLPKQQAGAGQGAERGHRQDSWPKLASIPCNITFREQRDILCYNNTMLSNISGGGWCFESNRCSEAGWPSVCWWEVVSGHLCFFGFFFFFSSSLTKLSLSQPTSSSCICSSNCLPCPAGKDGGSGWMSWRLPARWGQPTTPL